MASRHFDAVNALTKRGVLIAGAFQAKGSGTPVVVSNGSEFTVARTNTGLYTVTLQDNYNEVKSVNLQIVQASPTNTVNVTGYSINGGSPGAQLNLLIGTFATPGSAVDITQTGTDCIFFEFFLRNSSVAS